MKITKVVIEGFHNVFRKTYEFSDLNYLYGRNGAGKSTVLQAIQLGLLGYVPGTNKTKQGVFTHSNNHTMAIKLCLDDNGVPVTIQRIWTKSKSSVTENIEIKPEGYCIEDLTKDVELPLFNFDDFTHLTANNLKDWFINYLPKHTFKTEWKTVLQDSVKNLGESIVDNNFVKESVEAIQSFGLNGVEEIRQANAYFKNQLSFMKSELTRKSSTLQSLIHYDDYKSEYTESELINLINITESKLIKAHVDKQNRDRARTIQAYLNNSNLQNVDAVLEDQKHAQEAAGEILREASAKLQEAETMYRELLVEHMSYDKVIKSNGICSFTQNPCVEIAVMVDTYMERQNELASQMNSLNSRIAELKKIKADTESEISKINNSISGLMYDKKKCDQMKQELARIPEFSEEEINIDQVNAELSKYKEMYGKAVANRNYNELSDVVLKDKYRIENSIECLKLWEKLTGVNGLQSNQDYNPFDELSDSINEVLKKLFMSGKIRCKFYSDGKANSFSFGIEKDEIYVPYNLLSSGEKCLFVLSMFIGLMNYTNSPLKIILIDDFLDHLDDSNFNNVFQTLESNSDIQYVFAGVKKQEYSKFNIINIK